MILEVCSSQLFDDDISALFAEKAPPAPAESYLMRRDLATGPAPDLHQPSVEIRILLQGTEVEENGSLSQREQSETKRSVPRIGPHR